HVHAGGISLHRRVEKSFYLRKRCNLIELRANLRPPHAEDGAVQVNVLATGQLWVKAGPNFKQTPNAARQLDASCRRLCDSRKHFEERAFACAVAADDPDDFAASHLKGHILQCPKHLIVITADATLASLPQRLPREP